VQLIETLCRDIVRPYPVAVPKLWSETIHEHRETVRDAILDTAWALAVERGALAVTMSLVAERAGIGRATLYKYFPGVEAILVAGHERHVAAHLHQLRALRDGNGEPAEQMEAVLAAYALICYHRSRHGASEVAALVHRREHVDGAYEALTDLFDDLLTAAARAGHVRDDVAPAELAAFCLHSLGAAGSLPSEAAVHRLVNVTTSGLRPRP
jgi:AcrR family transcriptional regulator